MRVARWAATAVVATGVAGGTASIAGAARCPSRVGPGDIASSAALRAWNAAEYGFGHPRPTRSPAQRRFIDWLEVQARRTPGVRLSSLRYRIERWAASGASLSLLLLVPVSPTGALERAVRAVVSLAGEVTAFRAERRRGIPGCTAEI